MYLKFFSHYTDASSSNNLFISMEGAVFTRGTNNRKGALGLGHLKEVKVFSTVQGLPPNAVAINAILQEFNTFVLLSNGQLYEAGISCSAEVVSGWIPLPSATDTQFTLVNTLPMEHIVLAIAKTIGMSFSAMFLLILFLNPVY